MAKTTKSSSSKQPKRGSSVVRKNTDDLHGKHVAEALLKLNREQSRAFLEAKLARQMHRNKYPTEFVWLKCMDGRLNGAIITRTAPGLITPLRSAGARFDLGWPYFMTTVNDLVNYAIQKRRHTLFFCTYHFSKGSKERGCKAFHFDTDQARASALNLRKEFDAVFGGDNRVVHAITVGIETDEDALILHGGEHGEKTLNLADAGALSPEELAGQVHMLFPRLSAVIVADLVPLLVGNIEHVQEVRANRRPIIELDHQEVALCIGRGFDWLHKPNRALIIGPWSDEWVSEAVIAGKIILNNLQEGKIPRDTRPALMVSALYREPGSVEARTAPKKANYLYRAALAALEKEVPALLPHMDVLAGTINMQDRLFNRIKL